MDNNQQNQSNAIGEMLDAANIAQPAASQNETRSFTMDNVQMPEPRPQITTANNGFTVDNIQQPIPAAEPIRNEENDEE